MLLWISLYNMITYINILVTVEKHIQVNYLDSIISTYYAPSTLENIIKLFFKIFFCPLGV